MRSNYAILPPRRSDLCILVPALLRVTRHVRPHAQMFLGLPCLLSRGDLTAARGFERRHTLPGRAAARQRRQFRGSRCEKDKGAAVDCSCGVVRPPSASREHTLDSPRCVARSHQTYSTVSTSLCIQIIKAAWCRGVVMLCDVVWELRNGKLRSTTARGTQRNSKLHSQTSSCDLTTL